jgi:hypothetical protein
VFGDVTYIQTAHGGGQDGALYDPSLYIRWRGRFAFNRISGLLERNEIMSLMMPSERPNSESLYDRPGCRIVSEAFSMSNKTATVYCIVYRMLYIYCILLYIYCYRYLGSRWSQWPRGLSYVLSLAARTLGSHVRIPLGACMCVRIFSVLCCPV